MKKVKCSFCGKGAGKNGSVNVLRDCLYCKIVYLYECVKCHEKSNDKIKNNKRWAFIKQKFEEHNNSEYHKPIDVV